MLASVIVCTRDRAGLLQGCLEAIVADTSLAGREVVVVDNGSTDGTAGLVDGFIARHPRAELRLLREPRVGKVHALNTGVREAAGDLLLFTDDDVRVQPGWAGALVEAMASPGVGAAGGRTLPAWPSPPPPWVNGQGEVALGLMDLGDTPRDAAPGEVIGANMALRAADLRALGLRFEPNLGPVGALKIAWEERHLLERLRLHRRLVYAPGAVACHEIDPARVDWDWVRRLSFQTGFGKARHERLSGVAPGPLPARLLRAAMGYHRAWLVRDRNRRSGARTAAAATAEFLAYDEAGRRIDMALAGLPAQAAWLAGRRV